MFENENNNPIVPVAPEQGEQQQPTQELPQPEKKTVDYNWKELKSKSERLQRERDEAMRRLQEAEMRSQQQAAQMPVEDDDLRINPDDLVEGKHINRMDKKVNRRIKELEEEVRSFKSNASVSIAEAQLKTRYNDFDKVVNGDSFDRLAEAHPELAASIKESNLDAYQKGVSIYKLIKQFGLENGYEEEKARIAENMAKPRPSNAVSPQQGNTSLAAADSFMRTMSKSEKDAIWKKMQEIRKAY